MKNILLCFVIIIAVYSCKKEIGNNGLSGRFSISRLNNLKSAKVDTATSDSTSFNLDTIKASKSFYFVLSNVGQEDIKNITITTDNENFKISPSLIQTLSGKKSSGNANLTQVLSLDIIHGVRLNGVGYEKLLDPGNNQCNINFTGQTYDGTKNINISLKAKIQLFAKVMDIDLYKDSNELDLTKPDGTTSIQWQGIMYTMTYYFYQDNPIVIKNIGNCTIDMTLIQQVAITEVNYLTLQTALLYPNDTLTLKLPKESNNRVSFLKLDSQGTICNQQRMSLGSDGIGYIGLLY
jgi:hypothetical protein